MKSLKSFGSIKLWHKFLLLGILWLLAMAVPTFCYKKEANKDIALSRVEQQALPPAKLMLDIIQRTQQHASLTARFLLDPSQDKNAVSKKERRAKAESLEEAIVDLEDYANKIKSQKIAGILEGITADWHQISQQVTVREISPEQSVELHRGLVRKQLEALQAILDSYQLTRDPEAAGQFLVASGLRSAPELTQTLAQLRVAGASILTRGEAGFAERVELKALLLLSQEKLRELDSGVARSAAENPLAKDAILQAYAQTREKYQAVVELAQQEILSKGNFSFAPDEFSLAFTQGIDSYYQFMQFSLAQTDNLLKDRINREQKRLQEFLWFIFAIGALAALVYIWFVRRLLRKLGEEPEVLVEKIRVLQEKLKLQN